MRERITTTIFDDTITISANWSQPGDTIYMVSEDGEESWPTSLQVSNFKNKWEAMRHFCEELVVDSGDDPEDFTSEIEDAVQRAEHA